MPKIEPYAAPNVYDPPMYAQAVKVTGTETILFIAGQVAYGRTGLRCMPGISRRKHARLCTA